MKVSELGNEKDGYAELDKWVAKAEGYKAVLQSTHPIHGYKMYEGDETICWALVPLDLEDKDDEEYWEEYSPTGWWHTGGPIIEREEITTGARWLDACADEKRGWTAAVNGFPVQYQGCTPLIAAMRAYVASKFGEEVE